MRLHVLRNDLMDTAIASAARLHTDPKQESLEVFKDEHADECETKDH